MSISMENSEANAASTAMPEDGVQTTSVVQATAQLAMRFRTVASEALTSGDDAEAFNAALEFAAARNLSSAFMARVLVMLRPKREVSAAMLRSWCRDAPELLGETKAVDGVAIPDWFVNSEIQIHAAAIADKDWKFAKISKELTDSYYKLNGLFFGGQLPPVPISFERASLNNLASYRLDRDGLALKHRINMNSHYVNTSNTLRHATLLHEMIHLWEDVIHGRHTGGSYHTARFRKCAFDLGIPTTSGGEYLGIRAKSPFARWLEGKNMEIKNELCKEDSLALSESSAEPRDPRRRENGRQAPRSRLARWTCGCERKVWVAAGQELKARCSVCERDFQRTCVSQQGVPRESIQHAV